MNRHQRRRADAVGGVPGAGSTPEQLADRLHMLKHNEIAIQMTLARWRAEEGDAEAAVLLIDSRDSMGRTIARLVDPDRGAEKIAGANMIPTVLLAVPRQVAYLGLRDSHPMIASALAAPAPPGAAAVVCIASEGITMVHTRIEDPPEAGSA